MVTINRHLINNEELKPTLNSEGTVGAALIFIPACSKIPFLHFGTGSGMAPPKRLLAEEDREEHAEAQGEEPESGSGGADGPDAAQFARSEAQRQEGAIATVRKREPGVHVCASSPRAWAARGAQ